MGKRNSYTWERIDFSTIQHELLKAISKDLRISLGGAVEYSLDRLLLCLVQYADVFACGYISTAKAANEHGMALSAT
jgi:hypothetical protein